MKIVIDARMYGPKVAKGLGRYVQELVEGLKKVETDNQYIILLGRENWADFEAKPGFKKVLAPWRWYSVAEQFYLPRLLKQLQPDLVHFPHFNVPLFYRGRFVVTVHDLILRRYHSRRASTLGPIKFFLKKMFYRLVIGSAIRRAAKVITVSQFSRQEILHFYKVSAEKVVAVVNGCSVLAAETERGEHDKETLFRYNITKPFLLYVGNVYPHKNLETLLAAFKLLSQSREEQMVLVGSSDYFYQRLARTATALGLSKNRVLFLGYISDVDLAALYRQAEIYVFPSRYEGFGLPVLEAMSYGCPVVATDIPAVREVGGEAVEYFSVDDPTAMAQTVVNLLSRPQRLAELRIAGREQVKKFSWPESVRRHWEIYQQVLSDKVRS